MADPTLPETPESRPSASNYVVRALTSLPVVVIGLVIVMLIFLPRDVPSPAPTATPTASADTTALPASPETSVATTGRLTVRAEIVTVCAEDADPSECFPQPFAGVRVSVRSDDPAVAPMTAVTDVDGAAVFEDLAPGDYEISGVYEPNQTQPAGPDAQPIRIDAGGDDEVVLTFGADS